MKSKAKNPWKKLSSRTPYKNPWWSVVEDEVIHPDGKPGKWCYVDNGPCVFIVAMNTKQEVYLIGIYRYPTKLFNWEIPGGRCDGESPLTAAKRELLEETGVKAKSWKKIGSFETASGLTNEIGHVYLATNCSEHVAHGQTEDGISHMKKVPWKKIKAMMAGNEITNCTTLGSLFMVENYLQKNHLL